MDSMMTYHNSPEAIYLSVHSSSSESAHPHLLIIIMDYHETGIWVFVYLTLHHHYYMLLFPPVAVTHDPRPTAAMKRWNRHNGTTTQMQANLTQSHRQPRLHLEVACTLLYHPSGQHATYR